MTAVAPARAPRPGTSRRARLELVGPAHRRTTWTGSVGRRRAMVCSAALVLGLCLLAIVASHATLAQGQFRLEELKSKAAAEQDRYQRLRLRVAELESPARVVAVAHERLGMVPPPSVTYLSPAGATPVPTRPPEAREEAAAEDWPSVKRQLARR